MSTFLTAEWRKLIMAQYEVSPATLAPWLPRGVEVDFYRSEGGARCYVSLVGFLFDRVRVKGLAIPFHTRFEEVNLRFYVRRVMPDGTQRRGVVFIREFVPRAAITLIANKIYEEPYATLSTHSSITRTAESLSVRYGWKHRDTGGNADRWHSLAVEAGPVAEEMPVGSEAEFLTEHYFGYTKRSRARDGSSTSEYRVQHPRWQVYPIRNFTIDADFGALYGPAFAHLDAARPASILLAEGSAVSVYSGERV